MRQIASEYLVNNLRKLGGSVLQSDPLESGLLQINSDGEHWLNYPEITLKRSYKSVSNLHIWIQLCTCSINRRTGVHECWHKFSGTNVFEGALHTFSHVHKTIPLCQRKVDGKNTIYSGSSHRVEKRSASRCMKHSPDCASLHPGCETISDVQPNL